MRRGRGRVPLNSVGRGRGQGRSSGNFIGRRAEGGSAEAGSSLSEAARARVRPARACTSQVAVKQ